MRYAIDMESTTPPPAEPLVYPERDGKPMADNTLQWDWMVKLVAGLRAMYAGERVFVAGDLFWYPTEGSLDRAAPDALVAIGRPPGSRGSYKQWEEDGITPQVVFEVLSPSNTPAEMRRKRRWYEKHGVDEYYVINPYRNTVLVHVREDARLEPIPISDGFISPRLGVRFVEGEELRLIGPDGRAFVTVEEREREAAEEREGNAEELRKTTLAFEEQRARALASRREADIERERVEALEHEAGIVRARAVVANERAEAAERRTADLLARLRAAGIDPDSLPG